METEVREKLELFVANTHALKKGFKWQDDVVRRLAALTLTQENKQADCDAIHRCHALIKENAGVFSIFRGNLALFMATQLSIASEPQKLLDDTMRVYEMLKAVKLHSSDYLVVAAYEIASRGSQGDISLVVNRVRAFYDGMKARHFMLTGQDDYIYTAVLGLSDLDVEVGAERVESAYNRLKDEFRGKNSVQDLAQVMALGGADDEAINRVISLRDAFRAQGIRFDKQSTLATLGVLALLPAETDSVIRDVCDAQAFLRTQAGFSRWSVAEQELLVLSAGIIASELTRNLPDGALSAALTTTLTNIMIAEQVALVIIISSQ